MKSFLKSTAGAVGGGLMAAGAITGGAIAAVTGLTPLIAGAVGIGAGAKKGAAWGKSVFAKTEDVDKSIEETAKVTEKETVGGLNIEVLNSIYKEVVGIRTILGKSDPKSEEREKALDARTRHKEMLAALMHGKKALPAPAEEKKDMSKWMALLPLAGLLGALGLSKLPGIIEKFPEYMEAIGEAIDNIQEFLADMDAFFSKIGMDFFGASALIAGIKGGAKRGRTRISEKKFKRGKTKTTYKPRRTRTSSPKPTGPTLKRNVGRNVGRGEYKPKPTVRFNKGYRSPVSPEPKPKPIVRFNRTNRTPTSPEPKPYKSFIGRNLVNRLGQEKLPGKFINRYGDTKPRSGEAKAPRLGFKPSWPVVTSGVSMRGVTSPRINPYARGYQGRTGLPPGQDWLAGRRLLSGGKGIGQGEGRLQGLRYGGVNPFAGRPYPEMGQGRYVPRLGTTFQGETRPGEVVSRGVTAGGTESIAQTMLENLSTGEGEQTKPRPRGFKNPRLTGGLFGTVKGISSLALPYAGAGQMKLPTTIKAVTGTPSYAKPVPIKTGGPGAADAAFGRADMGSMGRPPGNPRLWTKEVLNAFYPGWNNVIQRWIINNPWTARILGGASKVGMGAFMLYFLYKDLSTLLGAWWNAKPKTDRWPFGDDPADLALREGLLRLSGAYGSAYFGAMAGGVMASGILPPIGTVLGAIGGGILGYVGGNALMNFLLSPPMSEDEYHPSDYAEDADRFGHGGRYSGMGLLRNKDRSFATKHPGAALGHTIKPSSRLYEAGQAAVIYAGGPQYDNVNIIQMTTTDASQKNVSNSSANNSVIVNQHTAPGGIGSRSRF